MKLRHKIEVGFAGTVLSMGVAGVAVNGQFNEWPHTTAQTRAEAQARLQEDWRHANAGSKFIRMYVMPSSRRAERIGSGFFKILAYDHYSGTQYLNGGQTCMNGTAYDPVYRYSSEWVQGNTYKEVEHNNADASMENGLLTVVSHTEGLTPLHFTVDMEHVSLSAADAHTQEILDDNQCGKSGAIIVDGAWHQL